MHVPVYHGRDLRAGRVSIPGQVYHLTSVTHGRIRVFEEFRAARTLVQVLRAAEEQRQARTLAYVVMPDHFHWLMQLEPGHSLSKVMAAVKSVSARRIGGGRLWQSGFHDHAVRREEDLRTLARYIVANPLRAGLVRRIGDYPHWDAIWL